MIDCQTTAYSPDRPYAAAKFLPPSWRDYIEGVTAQEVRARRSAEMVLLHTMCLARGITPPPLAISAQGKPDFIDSPYHIGIANSDSFAAVALADAPIGLDMEAYLPHPEERIARVSAIFSSEERAALTPLAPAARNNLFIETWVRKEALTKLTGQGLAALRRSEKAPPPDFEARVRDANCGVYYYVAAYLAV